MSFLKTISRKIMLGYAAILVILTVSMLILFQTLSQVAAQNNDFKTATLPDLKLIEQTVTAMNELEIAALELYALTLSKDNFAARSRELKEKINSNMTAVSLLAPSENIQSIRKAAFKTISDLETTMGARSVNWDQARSYLGVLKASTQELKSVMGKLENKIATAAEQSIETIHSTTQTTQWLIAGTGITTVLITLVAFWLAKRSIVKPVESLSTQLNIIAKHRNLARPISIATGDEIETAADSVNELLTSFKTGIEDVRHSVVAIADSIDSLSHSAGVSESQVISFSTHVADMLEHINALQHSIEESAQRSSSASDLAQHSASEVAEGAQNVHNTAASIESLAKEIEASSAMLLSLKNAGDQVGSVVSTIAAIAEQTNLLALNAAIEAARAGESGRGFAVVADEVRTLASRTHESTHQINTILDTIVESISETVVAMDTNKENAHASVELANKTVESLGKIQHSVSQVSNENDHLSQVAALASKEVGSMRCSVDSIEQASKLVTQSSVETRAASQSLEQESGRLKGMVDRFSV